MDEIGRGNLDLFRGSAAIWKLLLVEFLDSEGVKVGFNLDEERGETDEPVTADVRRLIRCPGSLHGGSGLRVTPLTLRDLEDFDPLQDAVVFGDEPVPLQILKPFKTQMRGESYNLEEGADGAARLRRSLSHGAGCGRGAHKALIYILFDLR